MTGSRPRPAAVEGRDMTISAEMYWVASVSVPYGTVKAVVGCQLSEYNRSGLRVIEAARSVKRDGNCRNVPSRSAVIEKVNCKVISGRLGYPWPAMTVVGRLGTR